MQPGLAAPSYHTPSLVQWQSTKQSPAGDPRHVLQSMSISGIIGIGQLFSFYNLDV